MQDWLMVEAPSQAPTQPVHDRDLTEIPPPHESEQSLNVLHSDHIDIFPELVSSISIQYINFILDTRCTVILFDVQPNTSAVASTTHSGSVHKPCTTRCRAVPKIRPCTPRFGNPCYIKNSSFKCSRYKYDLTYLLCMQARLNCCLRMYQRNQHSCVIE